MERISDLLDKGLIKQLPGNEKVDNQLDPFIVKLVNNLFAFFFSICRGFEKQYSDPKRLVMEKNQWILAFQDEGLTDMKRIDFGMKRTRRESPIYTPTIGQFLDWCIPKPEELGIPLVR